MILVSDYSYRKRRVLLDLGGKTFRSSVLWFLRHYPLDFTEIHVFEVTEGLFKIPRRQASAAVSQSSPNARCPFFHKGKTNDFVSLWPYQESVELKINEVRHLLRPKSVPTWKLNRIKLHNQFVSIAEREIVFRNKTQVGFLLSFPLCRNPFSSWFHSLLFQIPLRKP